MQLTGTSWFADGALMLTLVVALAALLAASIYRRQRAGLIAVRREGAPSTASRIIYNDSPTVRVVDAQRVDRLRKIVQLTAGAHVDVLEVPAGVAPRFRITLKAVVESDAAPAAHIAVDFCGAQLSCGPLVREVALNEFIVPRTARDEPRSAVFHYHEHSDSLDFMRIKVRSLDLQAGTAEIDVMQVLGHWPTSD